MLPKGLPDFWESKYGFQFTRPPNKLVAQEIIEKVTLINHESNIRKNNFFTIPSSVTGTNIKSISVKITKINFLHYCDAHKYHFQLLSGTCIYLRVCALVHI
jgi:hypothetical protein